LRMIGKLTITGEVDVPEGEGIYHDSLLVHEKIHAQQYRETSFFLIKYNFNKWKYERPAYKAQIEFLISHDEKQDRFAWLRDILDMDYGQTKEDVEEMLDEIKFD